MELFTTLMGGSALGIAGMLATATSIIVEVLKKVLPDKIPTKIVTLIVAFLVMFGYLFATGALVSISAAITGVFGGFVIAFIAMFGFDSFKDIISRFGGGENGE